MRLWPRDTSARDDIQLTTTGEGQRQRCSNAPPRTTGTAAAEDACLGVLPLELQYLIIAQLDLASLVNLRQTSRLYRHVITADVIRKRFTRDGRPAAVLRSCCTECLSMPGLDRLILDATLDATAWRSVCFRCWRERLGRDYRLNPWPQVEIANGDMGYICQFCNWPIQSRTADSGTERLHAPCKAKRLTVLITWMIMAFLQFGLGILAAVLAWTRYKEQPKILIPASIDFGLAFFAVGVFLVRISTTTEKTYARALAGELVICIVRLPPTVYSARETVITRLQVGLLPKFGFGVFLINLIFRFLDFMGHALLNGGYDPRSVFLKGLPSQKKLLYMFCTFMVWFAYIPF
ncbi:Uu.00g143480.m01.CDS01 [Anthostomella pinea]|uniref:Uu.00g143480.m01.CDS01 n=1 Tax=Anthostomella pinea TaxID=933095 RepID=A0AAI8VQP2_9PEZI|nr:Uu.00g143480.m01.CDS01 [Anthostomella pinea]